MQFVALVCPPPSKITSAAIPAIFRPPSPPGCLPTPLTLQTVAVTDSCSSTTTRPIPPPSQSSGHAAHLRWQVQNRRGNRKWRLWCAAFLLVSTSTSLKSSHPTTGSVYLGTHTVAGKEVAIKLQPTVPRNSPIRQESKIYKTLSGSPGIPWIMWSGKHGDFDVMILDLLGPSLEDLFKMCNKHFSLKTVLLIADQLVSLSPYYHPFDVTRAIFPFRAALTLPPYPPPVGAYRIHPLSRFGPQRRQTCQLRHGCRQVILGDQRD